MIPILTTRDISIDDDPYSWCVLICFWCGHRSIGSVYVIWFRTHDIYWLYQQCCCLLQEAIWGVRFGTKIFCYFIIIFLIEAFKEHYSLQRSLLIAVVLCSSRWPFQYEDHFSRCRYSHYKVKTGDHFVFMLWIPMLLKIPSLYWNGPLHPLLLTWCNFNPSMDM